MEAGIRKCLIILILIMIRIGINAQNESELKILSQFNYEKTIYKVINGDTLDMILFFPKVKSSRKMPLMIYTHGGGWAKGSKYNIMSECYLKTLKMLIDNGVFCASIEYRLTRPGKSMAYDCVVDCKDAVRFLM